MSATVGDLRKILADSSVKDEMPLIVDAGGPGSGVVFNAGIRVEAQLWRSGGRLVVHFWENSNVELRVDETEKGSTGDRFLIRKER